MSEQFLCGDLFRMILVIFSQIKSCNFGEKSMIIAILLNPNIIKLETMSETMHKHWSDLIKVVKKNEIVHETKPKKLL